MNTRVLVGTASWSDPGFIEDWYPRGLARSRLLSWYASRFNYVEVNSTFYGLPQQHLAQRWVRETSDKFGFDVKLHKLLSRHSTETKLLPRDLQKSAGGRARVQWTPALEAEIARRFLDGVAPLIDAGKLGAFLLQMSPSFSPKAHELQELANIASLFAPYRLAVELRNRDWMTGHQRETTLRFFNESKLTLVAVDAPESAHFMVMPSGEEITHRALGYLRLHGRDEKAFVRGRTVADRFNYRYSEEELQGIADRVARMAQTAEEVHAVFNNNRSNFAPIAAERLRQILAGKYPELQSDAPLGRATTSDLFD
jgi:uncharacterized protein YecE (DUF72 family)